MKYAVDDTRMTAIANAVRAKTGKTDTMTVDEIPTEVAAVYDKAIDDMWEAFASGGTKTSRPWAFYGWEVTSEIFKPKYDFIPSGGDGNYCFKEFRKKNSNDIIDLAAIERERGIKFDFSKATSLANAFQGASIDVINVLDVTNVTTVNGLYWLFSGVTNVGQRYSYSCVKRVNRFIVGPKTDKFFYTFYWAVDLEHCVFEGEISKNGLAVSQSTKLDHESLLSIVNCLKDYSEDTSGTAWKVTLGATNLAKLTAEEKAIATGKGWTLE